MENLHIVLIWGGGGNRHKNTLKSMYGQGWGSQGVYGNQERFCDAMGGKNRKTIGRFFSIMEQGGEVNKPEDIETSFGKKKATLRGFFPIVTQGESNTRKGGVLIQDRFGGCFLEAKGGGGKFL